MRLFADNCIDMLALAAKTETHLTLDKHITGTGRPRLDFATVMPSYLNENESTWVYFSGPNGFMNAGEQVCIDLKSSRKKSAKAAKVKSQLLEWYCARWDV